MRRPLPTVAIELAKVEQNKTKEYDDSSGSAIDSGFEERPNIVASCKDKVEANFAGNKAEESCPRLVCRWQTEQAKRHIWQKYQTDRVDQ